MIVFDHMIRKHLYEYSVDNWGIELRADYFDGLKDYKGQINYENEIFIVTHHDGGGEGMGAYPPKIKVLRIKK